MRLQEFLRGLYYPIKAEEYELIVDGVGKLKTIQIKYVMQALSTENNEFIVLRLEEGYTKKSMPFLPQKNIVKLEFDKEFLSEEQALMREEEDDVFLVFKNLKLPIANFNQIDTSINSRKYPKISWGLKAINAINQNKSLDEGAGLKLAVLDNGIDDDHSTFDSKNIDGHNFENGNTQIDNNGSHGTSVSSIICGKDFEFKSILRRVGVARNVEEIEAYNIFEKSNPFLATEYLIDALIKAFNAGASVINISAHVKFSEYYDQVLNEFKNYPIKEKMKKYLAREKAFFEYHNLIYKLDLLLNFFQSQRTFLVLASSGNSSDRERTFREYGYSSFPAIARNVLSVGSIAYDDERNEYYLESSSNKGVDFLAPGSNNIAAKPRNGLTYFGKTSAATAFATGATILWVKYFENQKKKYSNVDVIKAIKTNCTLHNLSHRYNYNARNHAHHYGAGIIQCPT